MNVVTFFKGGKLLRHSVLIFTGISILLSLLIEVPHSRAQSHRRRSTTLTKITNPASKLDPVERAIITICQERAQDPQGTIPIDQMAIQHELLLTDLRVIDGKKRAERLLPIAKKLVPLALSRLAASHNLEPVSLKGIVERVEAVNIIRADVEEHDNSSWRPNEPHAIIFGTVFLAGLRSDEAMITVIAHELTHAVNSTDQALQPLISRIDISASHMNNSQIGQDAAVEIMCERVGIQVMRDYISRTSSGVTIRRRLARALEKDCVSRDLADETHLSPRKTIQLLLRLEPELVKAIAGRREGKRLKKRRH